MNKDQIFLIELSHVLFSVGSSVQCVTGPWFIYTLLKFWGLRWVNAGKRMHERNKRSSSLRQAPQMSAVLLFIHQEGMCVKTDVSPGSEGPKRTSLQLQSRTRNQSSQLILLQPFLFCLPSHCCTLAALFPPGGNFRVGGRIIRPVWKWRFPKRPVPLPHHQPSSPEHQLTIWVLTSNKRPLGYSKFRPCSKHISAHKKQKQKKRSFSWYSWSLSMTPELPLLLALLS